MPCTFETTVSVGRKVCGAAVIKRDQKRNNTPSIKNGKIARGTHFSSYSPDFSTSVIAHVQEFF